MKKFRLVVRIASILFILLTILLAINGEHIATEGFTPLWGRGYITFLENSLTWWFIGLVVSFIQLIMENLQIIGLRNKMTDTEIEVSRLKAQLDSTVETTAVTPRGVNRLALVVLIIFFIYMICTFLIDVYLEELLGFGVYTFYQFIVFWGILGLVVVSLRFFLDIQQILSLKKGIRKGEEEILNLKASLFDQSNSGENPNPAPDGEDVTQDSSTGELNDVNDPK